MLSNNILVRKTRECLRDEWKRLFISQGILLKGKTLSGLLCIFAFLNLNGHYLDNNNIKYAALILNLSALDFRRQQRQIEAAKIE